MFVILLKGILILIVYLHPSYDNVRSKFLYIWRPLFLDHGKNELIWQFLQTNWIKRGSGGFSGNRSYNCTNSGKTLRLWSSIKDRDGTSGKKLISFIDSKDYRFFRKEMNYWMWVEKGCYNRNTKVRISSLTESRDSTTKTRESRHFGFHTHEGVGEGRTPGNLFNKR